MIRNNFIYLKYTLLIYIVFLVLKYFSKKYSLRHLYLYTALNKIEETQNSKKLVITQSIVTNSKSLIEIFRHDRMIYIF